MKILRFLLRERKNSIWLSAGAIALFVLLLSTAAFGDGVDAGLPPDTPQAVKAGARQAIENGLQQDDVVKLTRAMLQNQFEEQQIQMVHALMIEANNSGMPVQPLMNKAFEGMVKGVDPSLIVGAMEEVQSRNAFAYRRAARLSRNKSQTANLGQALSAALSAGFSKEDADRTTEMLQQQSQSMKSDEAYSLALECFITARDVSRLGVSSQAVTDMLANALNKGFSHQDMHAMRSAFMIQARQSQPQNLAHSYSAAIQAGRGFQEGGGGGHDASGSGHSGGASGGGNAGGSGGPGGSGGSGGSGSGGGGSGGPGGNK
jgi:hypothetical protein